MLTKFFMVLAVSSLCVSYGADEGAAKGKDTCGAEVKKVCGNVERGEGRMRDCIAKNMSSFSPQCQERVKLREEQFDKMKACHEEIKKLCGSVEKGEGRKKKCLEENKSKLSPDCQAIAERIKNRFEKRQGKKEEKVK